MHFSLRLTGFMFAATALSMQPAVAQQDSGLPPGLDIPANAQLLGNADPNVYRPQATVNGEIITATDVEQRVALIRIANEGRLPEAELPRLRLQVFGRLIDEMLQIQEARAIDIAVEESDVDTQYARIAASFRMTPEQFTQFLNSNGASMRAMKQQIRGELAWQNLLGRNIEPFTQVSEEEARDRIGELEANRGNEEVRVGEIYLRATPQNIQAVAENARRVMEQLGQGASFPDAARQFSESSTAAAGGDLGWLRPDQLPLSLAAAVREMEPGQLAGPVEAPGGISILLLIDRRRVLTADPRDAVLSLKQLRLNFPAGITQAQATELGSRFASQTRTIAGCGQADAVAQSLGAQIISQDQVALRDLPPMLQSALSQMQIGQVTPPFGSPETGISVLVLCGRDMPGGAQLPSVEEVMNRMRNERVERRAARYLRDLRRDAVIDYS